MTLACVVCFVGIFFGSGRAEALGFSVGYAHSASLVCDFAQSPMFLLVDYQALDPDANFRGTRNFFVALRIYGKSYACADALENYGPRGVIRRGLLERNPGS